MELTHNWDPEPYAGGRNFGHLAYAVDDIYATCERLAKHGVTISRPPRDGRMAFVRSPDGISVELLQSEELAFAEPWAEYGQYWRVVIFFIINCGRAYETLIPDGAQPRCRANVRCRVRR